MTDPILRKPSEWAALDHIQILDPDGWRSPNEKDFDIPISEEEWHERSMRCTIRRLYTLCPKTGNKIPLTTNH